MQDGVDAVNIGGGDIAFNAKRSNQCRMQWMQWIQWMK